MKFREWEKEVHAKGFNVGQYGTQNKLGCLDVGPVQGRKGGEMERLMKAGPWKP